MAKKDTHLILVVDRSGSMSTIREKAQDGINSLLDEQRKAAGKCTLTLYEFDDKIDKVYNRRNVKQCSNYDLKPRASTALWDAMGTAISEGKEQCDSLTPRYRPGLVIVCVVTDGFENASRNWNKSTIASLVKSTSEAGWQYTFLCTDPVTQKLGKDIGIVQTVSYSTNVVDNAYQAVSSKVTRMRGMQNSLQQVDNSFTPTELNMMVQIGSK